MSKQPQSEQFSEDETARRATAALKRALNTPHKPHRPLKSAKKSQAKKRKKA